MTYDNYYQTENLFGKPYPELTAFFEAYANKGNVLDLGCGQGRDAIALARIGYSVTGIDNSKVGIEQMNRIAKAESLALVGVVTDIFEFDDFAPYDFILLDSMFHFAKKDKKREIELIQKIITNSTKGCLVVVCIQDTGSKVQILNEAIDFERRLNRLADNKFKYVYEDSESGHSSESDYRLIIAEK